MRSRVATCHAPHYQAPAADAPVAVESPSLSGAYVAYAFLELRISLAGWVRAAAAAFAAWTRCVHMFACSGFSFCESQQLRVSLALYAQLAVGALSIGGRRCAHARLARRGRALPHVAHPSPSTATTARLFYFLLCLFNRSLLSI